MRFFIIIDIAYIILYDYSNCTLIYEEMRLSSCVPDVKVDHLTLTFGYYCSFFIGVFLARQFPRHSFQLLSCSILYLG